MKGKRSSDIAVILIPHKIMGTSRNHEEIVSLSKIFFS
jgi:hypothetical protein